MLDKLGILIEKKPWIVISIILIITIGFGSLIPSLKMETSTEDFMPDNELVNANTRIADYFGQSGDIIMILVEKQNSNSVISPDSLREELRIINDLNANEYVNSSVSIVGLLDLICLLEFGDSLENCSDNQIITAYNDLMVDIQDGEISMLDSFDKNEDFDFVPYPKLSKGISRDSLDIKNYFIEVSQLKFMILTILKMRFHLLIGK